MNSMLKFLPCNLFTSVHYIYVCVYVCMISKQILTCQLKFSNLVAI